MILSMSPKARYTQRAPRIIKIMSVKASGEIPQRGHPINRTPINEGSYQNLVERSLVGIQHINPRPPSKIIVTSNNGVAVISVLVQVSSRDG